MNVFYFPLHNDLTPESTLFTPDTMNTGKSTVLLSDSRRTTRIENQNLQQQSSIKGPPPVPIPEDSPPPVPVPEESPPLVPVPKELAVGVRAVTNSGVKGVVRYLGSVKFAEGKWVGLELDDASGRC